MMARFALAMVAALFAAIAVAATSDRQQPAEIRADKVHIDQRKDASRYVGNVIFTQGTTRITGDDIELRAAAGEIETLVINGTPATYTEREDDGLDLRGRAKHINYDKASGLFVLTGDAWLCRAGEQFRAQRIEYNTLTRTVDAGKVGASSEERVHITLVPGVENAEKSCQ